MSPGADGGRDEALAGGADGSGPRRPRLLFVHAHPDDETLSTGVSLAHHALLGHDVHVLTCTLGEEGEVIPPELAHLEGAPGDPLARHRRAELASALATLGVTGHLLGENAPGHRLRTEAGTAYRDSGMAGSAAARHPLAFAAADVEEAGSLVRDLVERLRPDVVVTYDAHGGYLHPDHVQTHRVTVAALRAMPSPPPLYAVVTPRSWVADDRAWLAANVDAATGVVVPGPSDPLRPNEIHDDLVTRSTVDHDAVALQEAALRHHATQVVLGRGWYTLSNRVAARLAGREGFALVDLATGGLASDDPGASGDPADGTVGRTGTAGRPGLLEGVSA